MTPPRSPASSRPTAKKPAPPPPRIFIDDLTPAPPAGGYPIKRVVGEPIQVEATVLADGHDRLRVVVAHQVAGARPWDLVAMELFAPGDDRWGATVVPVVAGVHRVRVSAWIDEFGSWAESTTRKLEAGQSVDSECLEGAAILDRAATRLRATERGPLLVAAQQLRGGDTTPMTDRGGDLRRSAIDWYHASLKPAAAVTSTTIEIDVERERALFSSWYEWFPRSIGPSGDVHGTLADVEAQLDYVAEMGFDILYLPPIHPIGAAYRKGPNNGADSVPGDPGSPWAIGSHEGGHTAIHPELGTIDDFRSLVKTSQANGIELALDIAFQCSPDHPWVHEHPEWFKHRSDGSIQYAENPPKKYQDIYPLHFDSEAWRSLWGACRDVVMFWAHEGVRVFRIDNPHTKPFAFWAWLIAEVRAVHPESIFLSEAFTRPAVMHRLAAVGFTQSYSYFPWRVSKWELTDYFTELSTPPSVDRFRPSAWPNTPDILPWHLMDAPLTQFAVRVFLAATLSPSYGVYGPAFELGDNRPAGNGKEEYLDSEKYQMREWNRVSPDTPSLRGLLTDLNRIRIDHAALHTLRTLGFHHADNDQVLVYSKTGYPGPSVDADRPHGATILVVANLDPVNQQRATVSLDLAALGVDPDRSFEVHDLLSDRTFSWAGPHNYVELNPDTQPGHIFRVTQSP